MAVRYLTVLIDDRSVVRVAQHGHIDGSPEGNGTEALEFARRYPKFSDTKGQFNKVQFTNAIHLNEYDKYLKEIEVEGIDFTDEQNELIAKRFPIAGDNTLGVHVLDKIMELENHGSFINSHYTFGYDSKLCSWGYVIDYSQNKLDVYIGDNKIKKIKGLWSHRGHHYKNVGIHKLVSFDLNNLPDRNTFLQKIDKAKEGVKYE